MAKQSGWVSRASLCGWFQAFSTRAGPCPVPGLSELTTAPTTHGNLRLRSRSGPRVGGGERRHRVPESKQAESAVRDTKSRSRNTSFPPVIHASTG
ncbi:hypothetical protein N657DRAFT_286603 [Parathielavia appendiculata]|uniref:Uncharacterized protein n=1 Tax=Parathielavia appendiculata TaxID=2587402 RepID=A0AAN6U517_9PEZI|nr:hypothetical protein N657DRAFT_286603 [Parathielavia appendiculata]